MAHAEKVACQERVVDHHLQNSVHVASLTKIEQASHTTAAAWSLRGIGSQVRVIFFIAVGDFALFDIVDQGWVVYQIIAASAVDSLLADGKFMLCSGEMLVQGRKAACGWALQTGILHKIRAVEVLRRLPKLADLVDGVAVHMLAASCRHMQSKRHD